MSKRRIEPDMLCWCLAPMMDSGRVLVRTIRLDPEGPCPRHGVRWECEVLEFCIEATRGEQVSPGRVSYEPEAYLTPISDDDKEQMLRDTEHTQETEQALCGVI